MSKYIKKENPKNNGGRPSKYKEEYCDLIIEWFDREPFETVESFNKNGQPVNITKPAKFPTLENFANHLKVGTSTLTDWASEYAEFSAAIIRAKQIQKDILVQNGLFGLYEKSFAKFVAVNVTNMRDKVESVNENTNTNTGNVTLTNEDKKEFADIISNAIKSK